jgi:hypothetical protein
MMPSRDRSIRKLTLLAALCCLIAPLWVLAQPPSEYQVKAAFLLNFAQFIEWPAGAFSDGSAPIAIGVLGDDPFGDILESTLAGESAQGRPLVVKRSKQVEDLKDCHLLFISSSEKDHVTEILQSVKDSSAVTVSEFEGFGRRGGIINFVLDNKKVRFEINSTAARNKKLKISSQLLKRAKLVD